MATIVLDIEGTTTAVDFVYKTLFPYSCIRLDQFINANQNSPAVAAAIELVKTSLREEQGLANPDLTDVVLALKDWTKEDRKHGALKQIQGWIWKQGYESGEIKSHIYEDVPKAFRLWKKQGHKIGIYSSGSVEAQKLLFKYSDFGDLTSSLSFHFDTQIGQKREAQSYANIREALGASASTKIIFLSDVPEELAAAESAGFKVVHVVREGTKPSTFPIIFNFLELRSSQV